MSLSEPFIGFHPNVATMTWSEEDRLAYCIQRLFVRIVKRRETISLDDSNAERVSKLGVGVDGGFQNEEDKYREISIYSIVVLSPDGTVSTEIPYSDENKNLFPIQVVNSADAVISNSGMAMQQDVMEWEMDEEPKPVSKYCDNLEFVDNGVQINPDPSSWKCEKSGDTENLWLNLSDGYIGGGRRNWDGSGGSNGALDHFEETGEKYPLVVKLGTITADIDSADCYSYAKDENGPVKIPNLSNLLAKRGINISSMKKTAKSISEMEVELNATYAFDAITEESQNLEPINGPGLQGLKNLGNSCYINSVVQSLFSGTVPELSARYGAAKNGNIFNQPLLQVSPTDAPLDFLCQSTKLASALTSGAFAIQSSNMDIHVAPRMFKHVVGRNHVDFKTGQQQDAAQYLQFFLESLDRAEKGSGSRLVNKVDASQPLPLSSSLFAHRMEERILCKGDNLVKYREGAPESIFTLRVPMELLSIVDQKMPELKRQKSEEEKLEVPTLRFQDCIDAWASPSTIEDFRWAHLQNEVYPGISTSRFLNFPRFLIVQIQRYTIGEDWTPKKLEVKISMPEIVDLSSLRASGPQNGEQLVPHDDSIRKPSESCVSEQNETIINEGALCQLMDMGFSMNGCQRALHAVGGSNIEAAMNWIFEHSQDPDFNDPIDAKSSQASPNAASALIDDAIISSLVENLGCFTYDQVKGALQITSGSADRAADWLFSHMVRVSINF